MKITNIDVLDVLDTIESKLLTYQVNSIYVPYSNEKYRIDKYGQIINNEDEILDVIEKENEYYIKLDWVNGEKFYNLAMVVIVTCRPYMLLPKSKFELITPLYRNNNTKDLTPSNLTYKLPIEGIAVEDINHKGFCYVPEYTRYGVNKDCHVLDIVKNIIKIPRKRDSNDRIRNHINLINDHGSYYNVRYYRILAMTFIDHSSNYENLTINHKDGNCQNNVGTNLEWLTIKDNNIHAFDNGLMLFSTQLECKNFLTNEILKFRSILQCSYYFNVNKRFIKNSLKVGFMKLSSASRDFYYIKHIEESYKENIDLEQIPIKIDREPIIPIKAYNVFTKKETIFSSIKEAARGLPISECNIHRHFQQEVLIPTKGYIFRRVDDEAPYPLYNSLQLKTLKKILDLPGDNRVKSNKAFLVLDLKTQLEDIWIDVRALCFILHTSYSSFYLHVYKENYIFHNRYKVSVIRLEGTIPI